MATACVLAVPAAFAEMDVDEAAVVVGAHLAGAVACWPGEEAAEGR